MSKKLGGGCDDSQVTEVLMYASYNLSHCHTTKRTLERERKSTAEENLSVHFSTKKQSK